MEKDIDNRDFHKLLVPRPTLLVTTVSKRGRADVSPFSFNGPISFDPPLLMISVGPKKHSYWSITQKEEFVVNIPTEDMLDKVWATGGDWKEEKSKIEEAGLETGESDLVAPPLLSECPVNIECMVKKAKKEGDHIQIIGEVIKIHVDEDHVDEEGNLKVDIVRPPLHLSGNKFAFPYVTKKAKKD